VVPPGPRPLAVCVVSSHPLVLSTIRGFLPETDFQLSEFRIGSDPHSSGSLALPNTSVYIVEAQRSPITTGRAIETVLSASPSAAIIVIGEIFDEENTFPLLRRKVRGLVRYDEAPVQLARAIQSVSDGRFWVPRAILSRFVEVATSVTGRRAIPGAPELTSREREVLDGVLEKLSNKEIAKVLGITERGVKFHVSNLLLKHRVARRADLMLLFLTSH
jgi:two-component system, NarL family, response regulator DegU